MICASLLTIALVARATLAQPTPADVAAFRTWASEWLPTQGAWHAVYVPADPAAYLELHVGYEWESRAYYHFSGAGGTGRDSAGRCFAFEPNLRGGVIPRQNVPGIDACLDDFFPTVLLRDLVERVHDFRSIRRGADGGFEIVVRWERGGRDSLAPVVVQADDEPDSASPPSTDMTFTFDARGRMTRREHMVGGLRIAFVLTYDERSPSGFAVASRSTFEMSRTGMHRTLAKELYMIESPAGDVSEHFGLDRLRRDSVVVSQATQRSLANRTRHLSPVADLQRVRSDGGRRSDDSYQQGVPATSGRHPRPSAPWSEYRVPFVAGGVMVGAIGALAWWRRAHE